MTPQHIQAMDHADPLAAKRDAFSLPDGTIYLDGNSLGPPPRAVRGRVDHTVADQWGHTLIDSWNQHDWIDLPVRIGEKIAPLLGAGSGQVVVCDSISVNLFKLLSMALALRPGRTRILSQRDNFPTDLYMAQGLAGFLGEDRCELVTVAIDDLEAHMGDDVAVVMLTHVDFRTGRMCDMQRITQSAHNAGALVLWDLAHSAGALPLHLDKLDVDMAVGCGYKYLNGGPGAPAFAYLSTRVQNHAMQPLTGWMGHADGFAFEPDYQPARGVHQLLTGTPPILSMCALDAALDVFADVDLQDVRRKSMALATLFVNLVDDNPVLVDFLLASPAEPEERGSHVAFHHPDAYAICQALKEARVVTDFRSPDLLRIGFAPLYNTYADIWHAVQALIHIVESKLFREARFAQRQKVT